MRLRDVGWVWEGSAMDPGVTVTIYGAGEAAPYFGLSRGVFIFHENTALAMRKLAHLEEVVCDISKWVLEEVKVDEDKIAFRHTQDVRPERVLAEARQVTALAREFPHVTGAFIDDTSNLVRHGYSPADHARVYAALQEAGRPLRLWAVVYTHELDEGRWDAYLPGIDVINLWVWNSNDLAGLGRWLERARDQMPGKEFNVGVYIRDYPNLQPVPLERMRAQMEAITGWLEQGLISGFSILGGCLIDQHPEQAEFLREFIASH